MRLTINLDPDNYRLAKSMAKAEDDTISSTINRLIRKAVAPPAEPVRRTRKNGFPVSRGAVPVTPDMIRQVEDELA